MSSSIPAPLLRIRRQIDLEQLKMPLGFIRIIELGVVFILMAAKGGWDFEIRYTCLVDGTNYTMKQTTSDINIDAFLLTKCDNTTQAALFKDQNVGIGPDLYKYLVIVTIVFCVSMVLVYIFNYAFYLSDNRIPIGDLAATIIIAFGWLVGTFNFSSGVSRIEEATTENNVVLFLNKFAPCNGNSTCSFQYEKSYSMYATLSVASLTGCALVLIFFANIWFVYKETATFRSRPNHNQMLHQMQQEPYTLE